MIGNIEVQSAVHENVFVQNLKKLEKTALLGGGNEAIDRQHALGKKTARERIDYLLDKGSFTEVDLLAKSSYFVAGQYTDGVIVGFGTISGRRIAIYAQDFTIKGGSLGKRQAEKICKIMDMAANIGCPIIGIIDSGGARIEEGIHSLAGYGQIFKRNCRFSGLIPQISIILGPCAGGAVYSPALTDFIFMTESISQMFITGPQVIANVTHQTISKEDLGGSYVHGAQSGVAHIISKTEEECFLKVQKLLRYLPSTYTDAPPLITQTSSLYHEEQNIESLVPANANQSYDMHLVICNISDYDSFFEIQEEYAANIIIGFCRIDGRCVGVVANQPLVKAGAIDIDASCKAARFINFCDAFSIPIVTFVDTPGYLPGIEQEHNGIIRHGAKLLYAYASATIPKITIILRKAFGGAYIVMGSKELGADFNVAWPYAQIAVLGAKTAIPIIYNKTLMQCLPEERQAKIDDLEQRYTETFLNPFIAAENGYIDNIIQPNKTRSYLIDALNIVQDKVEIVLRKKHGNIPL